MSETMPLSALTPAPYNPRAISAKAAKGLRASIKRFGLVQPIVFNKRSGRVVGGHQRVDALAALGKTEAKVEVVDLSDAEEKALNVSLNNPGIAGEFTKSIGALIGEIKLSLPSLDFDELRFEELADPPAVIEDEVPEPPKVPVTKPGDLWVLGRHRVLCGDATKAEDVGRVLGEAKPFLMVTDPPYGVALNMEWRDSRPNNMGPAAKSYMRQKGHRNTTISGDTRADWSEAFDLVPSLLVAYVWCSDLRLVEVGIGLQRIGFELKQLIIWNKPHIVLSQTHYQSRHEDCWYARRPNSPRWIGSKDQPTVWEARSPKTIFGNDGSEEKHDHPTQKPVALIARPLPNHIKNGECFYEPFAGSGTAVAAAEQLDRVCMGLEIEPRYVDVIVERWQTLTGKKAKRAA